MHCEWCGDTSYPERIHLVVTSMARREYRENGPHRV
jgi:hypothetical protein